MTKPIPAFRWIESSPTAILLQEDPDGRKFWNSGHVNDVLHLGAKRLLVGSESGGLWIAEPNGTAQPLSDDWEFPDVLCLAQRRGFGPNAFLCGTAGALYRNVWDAADPFSTWRRLNLPANVSDVRRIVTLDGLRIVIATDKGIWWAQHGDGDLVSWNQALWQRADGSTMPLEGAWSGLARAGDNEVVAGTFDPPPSDILRFDGIMSVEHFHPILWGQHGGDGLVFQSVTMRTWGPSGLMPVPQTDLQGMKYLTIASCEALLTRLYAVTFFDTTLTEKGKLKDGHGSVFSVMRSDDGGHTWQPTSTVLSDDLKVDLGDGSGAVNVVNDVITDLRDGAAAGSIVNGGPIKQVSVDPTCADRIALAAYHSFISEDGGASWTTIGGEWMLGDKRTLQFTTTSSNLHTDHHVLVFAPELVTPDWPNPIFLATDGGVFQAGNWKDPNSFSSPHNRSLRTLQFYSPCVARDFPGSLSSTPSTRGIAAGGLQDNGNVWKPDNTRATWSRSEGGDGGFNVAVGTERYFHSNHPEGPDGPGGEALVNALWDSGTALKARGQLPVRDSSGAQTEAFLRTPIEPVNYPSFLEEHDNRLLHALGWSTNTLFGLFGDDDADNPFWRVLVSLSDPKEAITTATSHDGSEILLATQKKQPDDKLLTSIYRYDTKGGQLLQMTGLPDDAVTPRIVATGFDQAFAAFEVPDGPPAILMRDGDAWKPVPSPLPADPLPPKGGSGMAYGMDADDTDPDNPPILLVSTESKVWATNDLGTTWSDVSTGLPRQPHCSDLRFNRFKRRWLLGTWGRSLWQAGKLVQVGVSSLIQSDFIAGAEHHNFEALVLIGEELFHYSKDNRDPRNRWTRTFQFPVLASGPACIIRSDFPKGGDHLNFEALVLEGRQLSHWFRANSVDQQWHFSEWVLDEATGSPAEVTGPASMVQSTFRADPDHGNFEALIPMKDGLWHWFRNSASGKWTKIVPVSPVPGSLGCITTSDYSNDADGNRALEALVFEPSDEPADHVTGVLYHFFWKPDAGKWEKTRSLTDLALGPACLIQSDYVEGRPHHNLEALVWLLHGGRPVLQHFRRRDDIGSLDWVAGDIISDRAQGPASLIQSDFRPDDDHGNLESIFVELDNDLWHSFREASTMLWNSGGTVT